MDCLSVPHGGQIPHVIPYVSTENKDNDVSVATIILRSFAAVGENLLKIELRDKYRRLWHSDSMLQYSRDFLLSGQHAACTPCTHAFDLSTEAFR